MIEAPFPPNEEQRLATLAAYEILDTLPESQIDDITRLAATICGVPIALVGLIDRDRQWYKSVQGLDATEVPRNLSFCSFALLGPETMIVEDALLDVRFHDNPHVTGDPPVRFYAGAPLVVANGDCIGTLCVIDRVPRKLSEQQIDALRTLARHVVTYLELRRKSIELERAENRFRLLTDAAPVGIYLANREAARIYTNPAWHKITGLTLEESLGYGWLQAVHPEDRESVLAEWHQAIAEEREFATDFRFVTRHGVERYIVSRARKIDEQQNGEELWVGSVIDITQRRKAELALQQSEQQLQLVLEGSSDGYWDWNVATGEVHYKGPWASMMGYEPGDIAHIREREALIHPDDRGEVRRILLEHVDGKRPQYETEHRVRAKTGEWKWVLDRGKVVARDASGAPLRMTGTHTDIDERKRAEETLDHFFDLSIDLLCVAGMDGRFKRLNPAFTEVLGYSEEELLSRPFIDLVHPDDRDATLAEMVKLADGRPTLRFENRYLHRDGSVRWIAWTASPVAETGMIYAAARDVTDAKLAAQALHAKESALRSIIGSSLSGIVTFSRDGRIASVNPAAEKILGYSEADLLGRDIAGLLPEPPADLQKFVRTSVDHALGRITEWDLRRGDGRIVPVEMALFEFETADGKHLACDLQDVSERREVETMKREFVATVSHELRTPLTSIRGSLDLLKGEVLGPLTPHAAEVTAIAHRNTTRLIKLINDILDLDRLDSAKMEMNIADTDAATIIRTAAESVRSFATESAVEIIATASDDVIRADADRIVQVLVNLLSNAIKFSPRGSTVQLTAHSERGELVFEVEDHGRGIPRQYLERVFDRFQQVESSDSRTKGGSGLGLAICKAIVEQHDGSIGVVSEEGIGSTFSVRLPLAPRSNGGPVIGVFSTATDARNAVAGTLRRQGYEVVALQTARQVRTAIENRSISLLIVDANFDAKGSAAAAELLNRLRAMRDEHDVPVFVIASPSVSTEWIAENMTVFVPDASQASLLDAIRSCIARGAAQSDVLIVEDDAELLSVLRRQLERDGIAVRAVSGGREALAMIRAARPRLIVLDVGLPDIDGFDLVAILRSDDTLRALPLLVYTGRDLDGADRARLTLGPTRFLTKSTADDREFRRLVGELIRPVRGEVAS